MLTERLEAAQSEVATLDKSRAVLEAQAKTIEGQVSDIKQQNTALADELGEVKTELREQMRLCAAAENRAERAEAKESALSERLTELKAQISQEQKRSSERHDEDLTTIRELQLIARSQGDSEPVSR